MEFLLLQCLYISVEVEIQYCAKVMQAKIAIYRRYLTLINFKRYIERYIVTAIVLFLAKISGDIVYT